MPSFEISRGDAKYVVDVGDDFLQLPEERQQSILAEAIGGGPAPQSAAPAPAEPDTSALGALRHAGRQTAQGLASTARVLGAPGLASSLDGAVADQPNYQPATPELVEGVRNFDFGRIARNAPRAALENAGSIVAPLVGGAVAGLPGAAVASGALTLGQNVEARAQNNNRAEPTTSDYVMGGLTTAGTSAVDALTSGVGRAARVAPLAQPGVAQIAGQTARTIARDAGGEVLQSVGEQFGQTAGTERHGPLGSVDPAQALGEGIIGGVARGGMAAPGAVSDMGLSAVRSGVSRGAASSLSEDQLRSVGRVNQLLDDEYATAARRHGTEVPLEDVLKTARESVHNNLLAQLSELERRGYFSGDDDVATRRELRQVIDSAYRQNKALNEGEARVNANGEEEPTSLRVERGLRLLDENLSNLPEQARNNLKDALRDLDLISQAGQKQNRTGPLAAIGARVGQAAGIAGSGYMAASGNLGAAAIGLASSLGGTNLAARLGRTVGSYGDRFLGMHQPAPVMLRAGASARLRRMGVDEQASTTDLLKNNWSILSNPDEMRRAALGRSETEDANSAENRENVADIARRRRQREEDLAWSRQQERPPRGDAMDKLSQIQAAEERMKRMQEGKAWAQRWRAEQRTQADNTDEEIAQGLAEFERRRAALRQAETAAPPVQDTLDEPPVVPTPTTQEAQPVRRARAATKKSKKTPPPEKIEEAQADAEQPIQQPTPQGDEEPLQVPIHGPMRGWRAYVQSGVAERGGRATPRDIEQAVRGLILDGHLSVEDAAALLTNHGPVPDADLLGRIQSSIARDQGFDLASRPRGMIPAGGQQTDYYAGIHSPARWDGAARNNQAAYDRAREVFEKSGDWDVVELVNRMAAKGDKEFPHAARRRAVDAILATHPDVTEKARIRAYLNPLIRDED